MRNKCNLGLRIMCSPSYMETAAFVKKITDIMIASGDNLEQSAGKIGVSRKAYRMR